jgi:hypothetical protein
MKIHTASWLFGATPTRQLFSQLTSNVIVESFVIVIFEMVTLFALALNAEKKAIKHAKINFEAVIIIVYSL